MSHNKSLMQVIFILVFLASAGACGTQPAASPTATVQPTARPSPIPPTPTTPPPLPSEIPIGIVYPITGRLADVNNWGSEGEPFWQAAETDLNGLPEVAAKGIHFKLVVRTSNSDGEGARLAVKELVETEGVQAIAGLPTTGELLGSMNYLTENQIAAISSASTGPNPELMQKDTVYRLMPTELYMARKLADLAMYLGYTKAAIIYRTDGWGDAYAAEFAKHFEEQGYSTRQVAITPTHPEVKDYADQVQELSGKVAELGVDEKTIAVLAVWEGEDLNILHHAAADPNLSAVRWFAALAGPSLLNGVFGDDSFSFPDAIQFAYQKKLWSQENHPLTNDLVKGLWSQATTQLGREPRFEHVYVYDAVQLLARATLLAGTWNGASIAARLPEAATGYQAATGIIRFDPYGDRSSGDLDYFAQFPVGSEFEYKYVGFFYDNEAGGYFELLAEPQERNVQFCPEC
jgi:ABC-type branched-subunit amino acid transport system substrate-binding protein